MSTAPRDALGFLTRIPVGGDALTPPRLSRAAVWFPMVGLLVGGLAAATRAALDGSIGAAPATVLALLVAVLVTGAFHEDGLADAADAAGAHVSRERRHEILHDSRVGTYGALALVFAVAFPIAVLSPLDGEAFARTVIAAHVLGRWSAVVLALAVPHAAAARAGVLLAPTRMSAAAATAVALALTAAVAGARPGAGAVAAALIATAVAGIVARRAFGGTTGDVFGAANKLAELSVYGVLGAVWAA